MRPRARNSGFTLLEVLVTVAVIAMVMFFAIPVMMGDGGGRDLKQQSEKLRANLEALSNQSLFLGELLALRVSDNSWTPLRYDVDKQAFVTLDKGGVGPQQLPDDVRLEWSLDQQQQQQPTQQQQAQGDVSLSKAVKSRLNTSGQDQVDNGSDKPPQIFFFPSGESTPATFTLRLPDDARHRKSTLKLDSTGHVSDANDKENGS